MRSELCLEGKEDLEGNNVRLVSDIRPMLWHSYGADLCGKIRESVKLLSLLSESLSLLDMLNNSLAYFVSACTPGEYVRPDLTGMFSMHCFRNSIPSLFLYHDVSVTSSGSAEEGPLAIDAGRHPFAERSMQEQYTVRNENRNSNKFPDLLSYVQDPHHTWTGVKLSIV